VHKQNNLPEQLHSVQQLTVFLLVYSILEHNFILLTKQQQHKLYPAHSPNATRQEGNACGNSVAVRRNSCVVLYYTDGKYDFIIFWLKTFVSFFFSFLTSYVCMFVGLWLAWHSKAHHKAFEMPSTASDTAWHLARTKFSTCGFHFKLQFFLLVFRFAALSFILTYGFRTFSYKLSAADFCSDHFLRNSSNRSGQGLSNIRSTGL